MLRPRGDSITEITSYSFFVYFLFIMLGILIDFIGFSIEVFTSELALYIGLGVMALATLILIWAAHTGHQYRKHSDHYGELEHHHLRKGAYRFTRNPQYLGLGSLFVGFALATNSLAVMVLAALSFFVVNAWFIPHEEKVLSSRHKKHYDQYKEKTRRWF
jgi:protein-S-isoprenylcysteine O-methyltransferase Ste14